MGSRTAALPLVVLLSAGVLLAEAQSPQVFRASTAVVRVVVSVIDGGRPVTGLDASHFSLRDNRVAQHVDLAVVAGSLDVAVLVDESASTRGAIRPLVHETAATTLQLLTEADGVSVYALATYPRRLAPRQQGPRGLMDLVEATQGRPTAKTALWDGIISVSADLAGAPGLPYVVAITDGCDNVSWARPGHVGEWLGRLDVLVDLVWMGSNAEERLALDLFADLCHGPLRLEDATRRTGGRIMRTADNRFATELAERVHTLRSSYLLTYTPTGVKTGDGWHSINVRLQNGARGQVTARSGYYAGGGLD